MPPRPNLATSALALLLCAGVMNAADAPKTPAAAPVTVPDPVLKAKVKPLSPEDFLKTVELQPGYHLQLVAAEPMIREPVACVWDGNGRMYVAQLDSYMQDGDAKDEQTPVSRVMLLEDTDGDGRMDKSSVFADNLLLPRMILPLDGSVIIGTTNTRDLYRYTDTNGDGVSDKKELFYEGGPQGGNMEHQPSGLIWNMDNWIYTTYPSARLRYTRGKVEVEKIGGFPSQWGMANDDRGILYCGSAGGEKSFQNFQQPWHYGQFTAPDEVSEGYMTVWPIDNIPDTQGGPRRFRAENNTLNHFTAGCGHSVYRETLIPELIGNGFICEPVGRLIRRTVFTNNDGLRAAINPHGESEFIRSTDPNFRPVNTAIGPDGCLYIVDMYRGIIQQGNWTKPGSYLRGVIDQYGLAENIGRGRIYRLVKDGVAPRTERPRMLDEKPAALVAHLSSPNGWWRDTARKLIILSADKSLIPALSKLTLDPKEAPTGRIAAIWTLEGLDAFTADLASGTIAAGDKEVQIAAMQAAEPLFLAADEPTMQACEKAASTGGNELKIQAFLSIRQLPSSPVRDRIMAKLIADATPGSSLAWYLKDHLDRKAQADREAAEQEKLHKQNAALAEAVARGKENYQTICAACHAPDGKGTPMAGTDTTLGAPLLNSNRVIGNRERLIRIVLHGLTGPLDGKTYPGLMQAMASQTDAWLADTLSYVRNEWGHHAGIVLPETVAQVRAATAARTTPWTLEELAPFSEDFLTARNTWTLTSSHNQGMILNAIDGAAQTRWDTKAPKKAGMWVKISVPETVTVGALKLDTAGSARDYANTAKVESSVDGKTWQTVIETFRGNSGDGVIPFPAPVTAKQFRITLKDPLSPNLYWSIHELSLVSPDDAKGLKAAAAPAEKPAASPAVAAVEPANPDFRVLVFSKTAGFRHGSIAAGIQAIRELGTENNFAVVPTEDSTVFTAENLKKFQVVMFLNTTGDILNDEQKRAFEGFIHGGGGLVGVHSATDTEYKWPWYEKFIGAYFAGHPKVQEAEVVRTAHVHPTTDFLPERWKRTDEWYNFRSISANITVLLNLDEKSYQGGKNGDNHPAAWYQEFEGGRMFYTAGGHTNESYSEPLFRKHLLAGIRYAVGQAATAGKKQ